MTKCDRDDDHNYDAKQFGRAVTTNVYARMMVGMTAEHLVNEILAIRRYHVISLYSVQALSDAVHPIVESK